MIREHRGYAMLKGSLVHVEFSLHGCLVRSEMFSNLPLDASLES